MKIFVILAGVTVLFMGCVEQRTVSPTPTVKPEASPSPTPTPTPIADATMSAPTVTVTPTPSANATPETPAVVTPVAPVKSLMVDSPSAIAAENAAYAANDKTGIRPPNSRITYKPEDQPRIQYYREFYTGALKPDDLVKLLFKDSDFNRSVEIIGDLYQQDKTKGRIGPELDVSFQELGQKVGNAVVIYNQKKSDEHRSSITNGVVAGTLIGGVAGGFLLKEEWIPVVIRTKIGDRIPGYLRNALVGGVATGTTVFISMEAYHVINTLARPNKDVYSADPLLDVPSH